MRTAIHLARECQTKEDCSRANPVMFNVTVRAGENKVRMVWCKPVLKNLHCTLQHNRRFPRTSVKKTYDPAGLFFVHNGVGWEEWSDDGFVRKARG
jgi:hypothetical protein